MSEKKRARPFFMPSLVVGLLAVLAFLLPLVPQPTLQNHLQSELSKALQRPCQVSDVRLKVLPRLALEVDDLSCRGSELNLQVNSLKLDISILSLLSFSPLIKAAHLYGVLAEVPFSSCSSGTGEQAKISPLFTSLKRTFDQGRKGFDASLYLHEAICKLTEIPGCKSPLLFSNINGSWQLQSKHQSENFVVTGDLNGGSCTLQVTWYKVETELSPESVPPETNRDSGDRIEVTCALQGVSMPESAALSFGSLENSWRADFDMGDLEIDINGNPDGGMRFSGKLAAFDHHLTRSGTTPKPAQLCSQGAFKADFSGFFQRRDGYLNIKNIFMEYPGSATLFSRGLIRFREPLFVNLFNHLKVDDLARTIQSCPWLRLQNYQSDGSLEGDLKLVGNPFSSPVLKLELNSEKIVLQSLNPALESSGPVAIVGTKKVDSLENLEGKSLEVDLNKPFRLSDWRDGVEKFLQQIAHWDWIVKSDCRIESLELPDIQLRDLTFVAEKNLLQLEVERLAARFGEKGQARLSLILDDLLHEPRWQASLVAEKLNLKPFKRKLGLTGVLDAALVGGGRLGSGNERSDELTLKGKWQLRHGAFIEQPLFVSFNRFLEGSGGALQRTGFSSFSSAFSLRDKILRLDNLKIRFADRQLQARGRFLTDPQQFDLSGQLRGKDSPDLPFNLSGNLDTPEFTSD